MKNKNPFFLLSPHHQHSSTAATTSFNIISSCSPSPSPPTAPFSPKTHHHLPLLSPLFSKNNLTKNHHRRSKELQTLVSPPSPNQILQSISQNPFRKITEIDPNFLIQLLLPRTLRLNPTLY